MNKILVALILVMGVAGSANAQAIQKNQQVMQYDVYAGGIHALQSKLDVNLADQGKYDISLAAQTYGLLGKLAPWEGVFQSNGWVLKDRYQPQLHRSVAIWRKEEEIKNYKYNKNGSFDFYSLKDDSNDGSSKAVDDELTQGTTDILTATLATLDSVANGEGCNGSSEIFDGKRRFKLTFKQKREVVLEASRYNIYAGPAVECAALVEPVAGKWREKPRGWMSIQEQGRAKGTMPTVWFASVSEGQPAVPVKIKIKTDYGTLFMHMTRYETQGQKLSLKE